MDTLCCANKCFPETLYITIDAPASCSGASPSIAGSYTLAYYTTFDAGGGLTIHQWFADPNPGLPGGDFDGTDLDISFQIWELAGECYFYVFLSEPSFPFANRLAICYGLGCTGTTTSFNCEPFEFAINGTMSDGTNSCTVSVTVTE